MSQINVLSITQRIVVDPFSSAVAVYYTGPVGPPGPQGLQGPPGPAASDGDHGDIVVSGAGTIFTVEAAAITAAKLAPRTVVNTTSTAYTVDLATHHNIILHTSASTSTITVPNNLSIPVGFEIDIIRLGSGSLTIAAAAGVNVRVPSPRTLALRAQYSRVTLIKVSSTDWVLSGDLT